MMFYGWTNPVAWIFKIYSGSLSKKWVVDWSIPTIIKRIILLDRLYFLTESDTLIPKDHFVHATGTYVLIAYLQWLLVYVYISLSCIFWINKIKMLDEFSSIKGLVKINSVCLDNCAFKLHYRATVFILLTFTLISTYCQHLSQPIQYIIEGYEIAGHVIDSFCWISSTFTLDHQQDENNVKFHSYYQWICFVLFFQVTCFYFPRYLWKSWEVGKLKNLILNLNCSLITHEEKEESFKKLVNYFKNNLHNQKR